MSNRNRERGEMVLGRKDQKIAAPLPRSESRESNAAPPFEYRHATTTTGTTHMNCQLQGGCESREQRVELDERRDEYRGRVEGGERSASAANSSILGIGAN